MKLRRKVYETKAEKRRDFWIGFAVWFAVNAVLVMFVIPAVSLLGPALSGQVGNLGDVPGLAIMALSLAANVLALIYFGLVRPHLALGALAAFGVVLTLGLCLASTCFVALESL